MCLCSPCALILVSPRVLLPVLSLVQQVINSASHLILSFNRGISSIVRRVIERETGHEFAVKVIDVSNDVEDSQGLTLRQATIREISILRMVSGHPHIIELHESFESSAYIFLVFEL